MNNDKKKEKISHKNSELRRGYGGLGNVFRIKLSYADMRYRMIHNFIHNMQVSNNGNVIIMIMSLDK